MPCLLTTSWLPVGGYLLSHFANMKSQVQRDFITSAGSNRGKINRRIRFLKYHISAHCYCVRICKVTPPTINTFPLHPLTMNTQCLSSEKWIWVSDIPWISKNKQCTFKVIEAISILLLKLIADMWFIILKYYKYIFNFHPSITKSIM